MELITYKCDRCGAIIGSAKEKEGECHIDVWFGEVKRAILDLCPKCMHEFVYYLAYHEFGFPEGKSVAKVGRVNPLQFVHITHAFMKDDHEAEEKFQ